MSKTIRSLYFFKKYLALGFFLILLVVYALIWGQRIKDKGDLGKEADFLATQTAARIVKAGQGEALYDFRVQSHFQRQIAHVKLPPADLLPFIHPPFFVLPFILFASLPYNWIFAIFMGVNLFLLFITWRLFKRHLTGLARLNPMTVALACFSFFPYFVNLIQGQNATITLLILSLTFFLLKQNRDQAAGAVLALGLYKPQLNLVFALVLLAKRRWQAVISFGIVALILVIISYLMVGQPGFVDYVQLTVTDSPLTDGAYGVSYLGMHNWRAFARILLGPDRNDEVNIMAALLSMITILPLIWIWRGKWQPTETKFDLQFGLTIMATLLISPHLNTHDLTLWILVGALTLNHAIIHHLSKLQQRFIVGLIIFGSLIGIVTFPLSDIFHLQFTTLFMALLVVILFLEIRKPKLIKS